MSARCGNCRHWGRVMQSGDDGECRGGPPTTVEWHADRRGVWPVTANTDYCGAWSPRVPPPDPAPQEPHD